MNRKDASLYQFYTLNVRKMSRKGCLTFEEQHG